MSKPVKFEDLGSVVIDEQHKFGVRQRFSLWSKGRRPDLLLVSATPIPRTLALTLFGHMDHSELCERPGAERRVETRLLDATQRDDVLRRVREEVERGGRAFIVCPAVAQRKTTAGPRLASAVQVANWMEKQLRQPVGLVHGKLEADEKQRAIDGFAGGQVSVLVATVVVEVGLDVPDASLVVILNAERFGLSQLHQIRGRVGRRGQHASCLLFSTSEQARTRERLQAFAETTDGFRLAEDDLVQRGPGELLGLRQHGLFRCLYPEILTDPALLHRARRVVDRLDLHKSLGGKRFRQSGVASSAWIW